MPGPALIPAMRYRDPRAMIDWLCEVVGFSRHAVQDGPDGGVVHAELSLGEGMIMLGPETDNDFARHIAAPDPALRCTQCVYLAVGDAEVEAIRGRALARGAVEAQPLRREGYGGLSWSFRDPEGQLWSVGGYDPRAAGA